MIFLAGSDLDFQEIFFRRDGTGKLIVVSTGGRVGHVEIQHHSIPGKDRGIDISSPLIRLLSVGQILEGNKEVVAQDRFVNLKGIDLSFQFKMELAVPDIPLIRAFIG